MEKQGIPKGLDHLVLLASLSKGTQRESEVHLKNHSSDDLIMIGTSLSALYQAATCHRKCYGGGHVLEALSGRTYNLGCATYSLITQGFYDEALNLIRSIGEISNLMMLSIVDKKAIREWLSSDKKTRIKKFSPAGVRKMLEKSKSIQVVDMGWYTKFCEEYTHVTPDTKPNLHNKMDLCVAGGIFQEKGTEYSLSELATVLGSTAMLICRYFKFDDLFDDIYGYINFELEKAEE